MSDIFYSVFNIFGPNYDPYIKLVHEFQNASNRLPNLISDITHNIVIFLTCDIDDGVFLSLSFSDFSF